MSRRKFKQALFWKDLERGLDKLSTHLENLERAIHQSYRAKEEKIKIEYSKVSHEEEVEKHGETTHSPEVCTVIETSDLVQTDTPEDCPTPTDEPKKEHEIIFESLGDGEEQEQDVIQGELFPFEEKSHLEGTSLFNLDLPPIYDDFEDVQQGGAKEQTDPISGEKARSLLDNQEEEHVKDGSKEDWVDDLLVNHKETPPNLSIHETSNSNLILGKQILHVNECSDFQYKEPYQSPFDQYIDKKLYGQNYSSYFLLNTVTMAAQEDMDVRGGLTNSSKYYVEFVTLVQGGRRGGRHKKTWVERHKKRRFEKHKQRWLWFVFDPGGQWFKNRVDSF